MDPHFVIRKWYLDCISESGDAVIVYSAELSWRGIRTHYGSILATWKNAITCRTSMSDCMPNGIEGDTLSMQAPKLGISGSWKQSAASVERSLLETPEGTVRWNCIYPRAEARVSVAGVGDIIGLGYVECLTMTIPPWRLPMSQLRWGRFLSQSDSLVWIDWQGAYSTQLCLHNGVAIHAAQFGDQEISFKDHKLVLDRGLTLRSGPLAETILPSAPLLRNLLPGSLFKIEEYKWMSRGMMSAPEGSHRTGWAIHEVVHWNQ